MEWVVEKDFTTYGQKVLPWLERDPVRNSVPATMLLLRLEGSVPVDPGTSPAVAGATRIGPVWTPPEHRRHGYAGAATAALCAELRPGRVLLYADDANPSAVGVYTRIGFRPVAEWTDWSLEY